MFNPIKQSPREAAAAVRRSGTAMNRVASSSAPVPVPGGPDTVGNPPRRRTPSGGIDHRSATEGYYHLWLIAGGSETGGLPGQQPGVGVGQDVAYSQHQLPGAAGSRSASSGESAS